MENKFSSKWHNSSDKLSVIQVTATASIAAELSHAGIVAKKLALAAKNARFVIYRAGSKAAGMTVISQYFGELAQNTIELVAKINAYAMQVTLLAMREWQNQNLQAGLSKAQQLNTELACQNIVQGILLRQQALSLQNAQELTDWRRQLEVALEEMSKLIRAASVVVISSRLEANRVDDFRESLEEMADNIQKLADQIKRRVECSKSWLQEF